MTVQTRKRTQPDSNTPAQVEAPIVPDFIDNYLPYLLSRAGFLVGGSFNAQLPKGMGVPRWRVLAVLADRNYLTISNLARIVLLKQPTLTKVVDRLEAEGLVRRGAEADDKRKVIVSITKAGAARVRPLMAQAQRHQMTVLENFNAREQKILFRVLRNLIDRMQQDE